jgi:hypothetical protein
MFGKCCGNLAAMKLYSLTIGPDRRDYRKSARQESKKIVFLLRGELSCLPSQRLDENICCLFFRGPKDVVSF